VTRVTTVADPEAAAERAARQIALIVKDALARRGVAHISLAGGGTPRRAYELLADLIPDWSQIELWYGDERCVEPSDEQSNHQLVLSSLLSRIEGEPPLEHRIPGELGPEQAARAYSAELSDRVPSEDVPSDNAPGEQRERTPTPTLMPVPVLDIALLGLGEDGHTASLFPGQPQLKDTSGALCLPVHDAPKPPPARVTLTLRVLRAARHCLLLATGSSKADAAAAVLAGPDPHVPASLLGSARLYVVLDDAASPGLDAL
jgi:6-phosphogluconolactonase